MTYLLIRLDFVRFSNHIVCSPVAECLTTGICCSSAAKLSASMLSDVLERFPAHSLVDRSSSISTHIIRKTVSDSRFLSGGKNCNVGGSFSISYAHVSVTANCIKKRNSRLTSISYSSGPMSGLRTHGSTSTPLTVREGSEGSRTRSSSYQPKVT